MSKSINHLATADGLFFGKGGLDRRKTAKMVDEALAGCDDGELFLEYEQSESLSFDDGKLKSASFDTTQGFGLRTRRGRSDGLRPCLGARRAGAEARRRHGQGGACRPQRRDGRIAARHQPAPLCRRQSDRRRGLRQEGGAAAGDRRLCARQGAQGAPGLDLARGLLAGGRDHPRRRLARRRRAAAGAAQRQRGLRRRQPHGSRQHRLAAGAPPTATSSSRNTGSARPTRRSASRWSICSRCRRRPARCRWCWARAGRACCGTRRSATGWKATSIARRPRCSPA